MKKKVCVVTCILLSLVCIIPFAQAEALESSYTTEKMTFAHVKISGPGSEFMIISNFIVGFGCCFFIRLTLEEKSHIEINRILHPFKVIELDGSHIITLIGFFGYFRHAHRIHINGYVLHARWK